MTRHDSRRMNLLPLSLAAGLLLLPSLASAQRDGTPGNPPSTAVGRAIDGVTGTPTQPDGTPGNPPGTAVGRAIDGVTGTPTRPDGTPGNPPGTALGRAIDGMPAPAASVVRNAAPNLALAAGSAAMVRPRLSQLIGGNVYNDRNERIGEVDDILLATPAGTAGSGPVAIIQVGGFLGMGGRLVTLPLNELGWSVERERIVVLGATKESLTARPAFEYSMLRAR